MERKWIRGFQWGKVVALMIVFALVLGVVIVGMPIARADFEPNNSFDEAETVTAGSHVGSVGADDPDDFYSITVSAGQTLSVGVVPVSGLGVYLYFYDSTRSQVRSTYGGAGVTVNTSLTTNSMEPSYLYYIRIKVRSGFGVYTMDVLLISQDDAGSGGDAGDTFTAATKIASANATYTGLLKDLDVDDYYKLNLTAGQTLSVEVTPSMDLGVYLYFYDEDRVQKAYTYGGTAVIVDVSWTTNSGRTKYLYYIRIKQRSGFGVYTMDVLLISQDDAGSGGDAGDTLETATEIVPGTHSGFLRNADKDDCYKTVQSVTAGQGVYVKITPEETLGVRIWLYDKNKAQKAYNYGGTGVIVHVSASQVPETGIYCIKVESTSEGTYSMLVSIEPSIGTPTQVPLADNVQPDHDVTVSASVTAVQNTVSAVTLYYRTDEGDWTSVPMTYNEGTGLYDGTIPGFSNCMWVNYKIKAYNDKGDYFEDDNAGEFYLYHVIPEFSAAIIPPLLMILTLFAIVLGKKLHSTKTKNRELTT